MRLATIMLTAVLLPFGAHEIRAQEIRIPANLQKLAAKAKESVDVTLDANMLKLTSQFLNDKDDAKTKKVLAGLAGISVHSYEFDSEGQYDPADVEAIRAQLKAPAWSRMVGVHSNLHGGNVDIFLKLSADGKIEGAAIIAAEPKELVVVSISGRIDPSQLGDLSGKFHIPEFGQ